MSHYATKSQVEKAAGVDISIYPIYIWYIQLTLKYSAVLQIKMLLKTVHGQLAIKVNTVDNNELV